jgi:hypothetical protein
MDSYSLSGRILLTIIWIGFFTSLILSYYFYLRFRNRERMALIDKGFDVAEMLKQANVPFRFPWLRVGILVLGVGLGVLFTYLIIGLAPPEFFKAKSQVLVFFSSVLIFGGLALVIGDILERARNKKNG